VPVIPLAFLIAVTTALAYFVGGLPFGYWFVRFSSGEDIRTTGSGNIGATNVHRTRGWKAGIVVLLLDICKGFLAVWIAGLLTGSNALALALAAAAVMLGHCYPFLLGFKGGKAVACFVGAFLYLTPLALAVVLVIFVAIVVLSNYISLASIAGAAIFPAVVWTVSHPPGPIFVASIFAALLIIFRHKANVSRLLSGTENKFRRKGGKS